MMLFRYLLLVVSSLVFLSLSGCATTKSPYDHPPKWFKPEKQQKSCPDLSGLYDNMSALESEHQINFSLFRTLFPSLSLAYSGCYDCTVDIRWFDDKKNTLSVTISDPTGKLETTTRQLIKSSGDFRCENGALIIDYKLLFELVLMGGYTSGTNRFYKGSDGTAMCEKNYSSYFHYHYFIPFFSSATNQKNFLRWGNLLLLH